MTITTDISLFATIANGAYNSITANATAITAISAVFFTNPATITVNYTIPTNFNAMCAGPVTVANGVTVTVPSDSTWVIT